MTDPKVVIDPDRLALKLLGLREDRRQAPTAQFKTRPTDLRSAMETQRLLSEHEGIGSNAWKVAVSPDKDLVVAPLHPYVDAASSSVIPWRRGMKIEAEIAVRLGTDLPVRSEGAYSRSEIAEAVSDIHLGAELLWTGIEEGGTISFPLFLADRLGNMGYVLGPTLTKSILDTCGDMVLQVSVNGHSFYDAAARHPAGDVMTWLLGYANDASRPEKSLMAGTLITTGSLCGAFELSEPGDVEIKLGSDAVLSFSLSTEA